MFVSSAAPVMPEPASQPGCGVCGSLLPPAPAGGGRARVYCSDRCRSAAHRERARRAEERRCAFGAQFLDGRALSCRAPATGMLEVADRPWLVQPVCAEHRNRAADVLVHLTGATPRWSPYPF